MTDNIIQVVPDVPFAQIANSALRDTRLSFRARGILALVLSHSGQWDAPRDWLEKQSEKEGRDAIQTALNELTALGYRVIETKKTPDGAFKKYARWFHEPLQSQQMPENPSSGTEGTGSETTGNPSFTRTPSPEHQEQLVGVSLVSVPSDEQTHTPEPDQVDATGWVSEESPREVAIRTASTDHPTPFPATFDPAKVGYTKVQFAKDFPNVNPTDVLTSFRAHYADKGEKSTNWMLRFFTWADKASKWSAEDKAKATKGQRETDSMGLPLDRAARQRAKRAEQENHRQNVEAMREAQA